jgi:recombination protein RecT
MSTENQSLEVVKKDITTSVLIKIQSFQETGELKLPPDYNVENALKSAYIILSDPKNNLLEKCKDDKASIAESLLKMVVYGLNPIKKQCYFIPYGGKLECSVSYAGQVAIAKRYGNLKNIKGNAVFKGDTFEFAIDHTTGRRIITKHVQTLDSLGSKEIIGAYAFIELNDGTKDIEVMSFSQIKQSWEQGATKGNSPAHKNFPDQMAIKTVIARACKLLISTSDDKILYDPLQEVDAEDQLQLPPASEQLKEAKKKFANVQEVAFDEVEQPQQETAKIEVKAEVVKAEKEPVSKEIQQTTLDEPNF